MNALHYLLVLMLPYFANAISLYSPTSDHVIELTDANVTAAVHGSDGRLWVVEFYAHWCGHCQRFVPTWVAMAERFKGEEEKKMHFRFFFKKNAVGL